MVAWSAGGLVASSVETKADYLVAWLVPRLAVLKVASTAGMTAALSAVCWAVKLAA